jgi:hypothetical protein
VIPIALGYTCGPQMTTLFGRFFQLIGMILLPIALMIGLGNGNVQLETRMLFIGIGFFFAGWLMARQRS